MTSQLTRHARMLLIRAGLSEDEADQVLDRLQQELGAGKSSSEHERMEVVERELAQIKARLDDIQRKQPGRLERVTEAALTAALYDAIKDIVGPRVTVAEKVGGELGKFFRGIRDLGTGQRQNPAQQPTPTARPQPQQPPRRAQPSDNRGISDEELCALIPGVELSFLRQIERDRRLQMYTRDQIIQHFHEHRELILRRYELTRIFKPEEVWKAVHGSGQPVDQAEMMTLYSSYGQLIRRRDSNNPESIREIQMMLKDREQQKRTP